MFAIALPGCAASANSATGAMPHVAPGFEVAAIARVPGARELAFLPNGDLLAGTTGRSVYAIPNADSDRAPDAPRVFAMIDDDRAAGITVVPALSLVFVGTTNHVWSLSYRENGASTSKSVASVRSGDVAPGTDGDVHQTTSVAFTGGLLYVAAGSSCNATMHDGMPCEEVDPTRAAVSVANADGSNFRQRAKRVRNAIALAVNPETASLWIGDAGQDDLPFGHPYEFLDDLSAHAGDADYGWPHCEENHRAYVPGSDCGATVEPLVELPAYSTIVGAAFYPVRQAGRYAFPQSYRGGLFAAAHGSWHTDSNGCHAAPPRVVFVPMDGDRPVKPVDWTNPTAQWNDFLYGFQTGCKTRIGRPTGIAVGPNGSLFVADDLSGTIYRIRPKR